MIINKYCSYTMERLSKARGSHMCYRMSISRTPSFDTDVLSMICDSVCMCDCRAVNGTGNSWADRVRGVQHEASLSVPLVSSVSEPTQQPPVTATPGKLH